MIVIYLFFLIARDQLKAVAQAQVILNRSTKGQKDKVFSQPSDLDPCRSL